MSPYVRVAPGVETVAQAGEVLVFDGETVFLFSGTSALVWAAVPAQRSGRDVVAYLVAAFPGQPSVAEDTGAFLATLLGHGLVEETGPPALPYFRPPHVGWVDDGDGVLLTDLRTGSAVPLSATASAVWRLLPQVESLEEMATGLSAEFVDMPADVSASLERLLRQLTQMELLETA